MGVEGEVVGGQRQIGVEEHAQPLAQDGPDDARLLVPSLTQARISSRPAIAGVPYGAFGV
ncbi:MAG: hypothetical protein ACRDLA_09920 [Thermoleophilaceae bacterium]